MLRAPQVPKAEAFIEAEDFDALDPVRISKLPFATPQSGARPQRSEMLISNLAFLLRGWTQPFRGSPQRANFYRPAHNEEDEPRSQFTAYWGLVVSHPGA